MAEPHIDATLRAIPQREHGPLLAAMLEKLVQQNGPSVVGIWFPTIAKHWVEPYRGWPSQ
jgi:hypothetical protein